MPSGIAFAKHEHPAVKGEKGSGACNRASSQATAPRTSCSGSPGTTLKAREAQCYTAGAAGSVEGVVIETASLRIQPVHHPKARNVCKILNVVRHKRKVVYQCRGGDQQIELRDGLPAIQELSFNLAKFSRHRRRGV